MRGFMVTNRIKGNVVNIKNNKNIARTKMRINYKNMLSKKVNINIVQIENIKTIL